MLSLHYLYLLQLFRCQCLLHRLGCITGLNKDRYLERTQEGLGKLQEICAWDQARPCPSPVLLSLVRPDHALDTHLFIILIENLAIDILQCTCNVGILYKELGLHFLIVKL